MTAFHRIFELKELFTSKSLMVRDGTATFALFGFASPTLESIQCIMLAGFLG